MYLSGQFIASGKQVLLEVQKCDFRLALKGYRAGNRGSFPVFLEAVLLCVFVTFFFGLVFYIFHYDRIMFFDVYFL